MWKLTIEDDEGQRTTLELANDEYSIGRAEDASIRLTERNLSRRHAQLRVDAALVWTLEDGPSYNGTYVNGERVTEPVQLKSGDVIQLGDYRLEFADQQVVLPEPEVDSRKVRPDRLVMVIGPTPGCEFSLTAERSMVGRAEEAAVSINHASVSRLHCEIVSLGQSRWEVIDQGSANGIRINGVDLRRGIIEPGDALELGDVRLRYVAAGKYLRPGADMSQPLPAMASLEAMAQAVPPRAAPARKNIATIASIGAVVAVLIMGGVFFMMRTSGGAGPAAAATGTAMAQSEEEARFMLKTAEGTAVDDIEFAHKTLLRIPADSSLRESAEFKALEEKWADAMFAKAERTSDGAERARLLTGISENEAVSAEKRQRAASMTSEKGGPIDLDQRRGDKAPGVGVGAAAGAGTGRMIGAGATSTGGDAPALTAATAATAAIAPTTPDKFDMRGNKAPLMNRMRAGRASLGELQELKAICMAEGDRACRGEAVAAISKLKSQ